MVARPDRSPERCLVSLEDRNSLDWCKCEAEFFEPAPVQRWRFVLPAHWVVLMVQMKRVYEAATRDDGKRLLVDRLWPRGLSKERAAVHEWLKDVAPSTELRKWFGHDPAKWKEFQVRYRKELATNGEAVKKLKQHAKEGNVTLLYGAKDMVHNEAAVLLAMLKRSRGQGRDSTKAAGGRIEVTGGRNDTKK